MNQFMLPIIVDFSIRYQLLQDLACNLYGFFFIEQEFNLILSEETNYRI